MKFLKKNVKLIIGIVIGAILISGVSVYAAATYLATNVSYTRTGTNVNNVSEALNDLYTKQNTTISQLNDQISTLQAQLSNVTGAVSGEVNLSMTYTDIPLGFRPSKVILISPNTNSNWLVAVIRDTSNNVDFVGYTSIFPANQNTENVYLEFTTNSSEIVFTDNGFKAKIGANTTCGKYYYYAIK